MLGVEGARGGGAFWPCVAPEKGLGTGVGVGGTTGR